MYVFWEDLGSDDSHSRRGGGLFCHFFFLFSQLDIPNLEIDYLCDYGMNLSLSYVYKFEVNELTFLTETSRISSRCIQFDFYSTPERTSCSAQYKYSLKGGLSWWNFTSIRDSFIPT